MKRKNGNADQSESSYLSSKKGNQESREEPCEICGSVGIAGLMMICFKCRHTREHTYCTRLFSSSVHPIWLCEACRLPPRVLHISHVAAEDLMDTETTVADPKNTRVDDDHGTAELRANNDMEDVVDTREASTRDSSCGISANVNTVMHLLPSQPHSSPLAKDTLSSEKKEQLNQPTQGFPKKRRTIRVMGKHLSQSRDGQTPFTVT